MSIFDKFFKKKGEVQNNFSEGDVFYAFSDNQYHLYKLLKDDTASGTYHVLGYESVDHLPNKTNLDELQISVYHIPIAKAGFGNPKLFSKTKLTDKDFVGYYEYLKLTQNLEELVPIANKYYLEANHLAELKKHEEAIKKYSKAIDLLPTFLEALDNRAFCQMDLGRWNMAIEDFKLSLKVNLKSVLAEFSIGECYLKMKEYKNAIKQFEKAIAIDPTQQTPKDFLKKAVELDKANS